ncbi:hypothetical protein CP967_10375 [Streptomyces nitrosporeus]|uniref:Exo-alpha-sialidase n=1 Tax=Streptomyces nitrosporeus TaxID=28894 RepID=A0A5J6F7K1_9ACTN|nr:hypothetical protein CP967_10375 [Streptomyces nitrosporeus]
MITRGEASRPVPDDIARAGGQAAGRRVLMRIRVSRDSGRTWGRPTEVREVENPVAPPDPVSFPSCLCPRCTGCPPHSSSPLQVKA